VSVPSKVEPSEVYTTSQPWIAAKPCWGWTTIEIEPQSIEPNGARSFAVTSIVTDSPLQTEP
jgi:hypothetical protein